MKKIPTLFVRDPETHKVIDEVAPGCEWVLRYGSKAVATRKWDGTCVLIRDGIMYKRREVKPGRPVPDGFEIAEHDPNTGKTIGWLPTDRSNREDQWHFDGLSNAHSKLEDGTYELVGPKINGNSERLWPGHCLVRHGDTTVPDWYAHDYREVKRAVRELPWEGIVFHHPDGRMAKIKRRDFFGTGSVS